MKKKDAAVPAKSAKPKNPPTIRQQKVRSESLVQRQILAELGELFADAPMDFEEFQLALNEIRPGHTFSLFMQRKILSKLNKCLEEKWRALGFLTEGSTNIRVYSPCLELVRALSTATGLAQPEIIEFVLRDFAGQVSSGRFNFVESIVATQLQSNVVVSTATKILDKLDLSTDDRLKNIVQTRLDQRKRNIRFRNFIRVPVVPTDEVV